MIELPILDKADVRGEQPGVRFWRSYAHLKNDPSFQAAVQDEFSPEATEPPSGANRRQFLQVMGATMALAGLTACRRPVEKILPYSRKPEEIIEGVSTYYATAMPFRGSVRALLVESHEGRPTKVEGNPEHPDSLGATSLFEQASILDLYDPDRSQRVLHQNAAASWADFVRFAQTLGANTSARVAVLAAPTSSPTLLAARDRLLARFPQARWITYRAEGDAPQVMGLQLATGRPLRPRYDFTEARVIVSLDADFLGPTEEDFLQNTRTFALSRYLEGPQDEMSRLYVVESDYTLTGAKADHRLRLRASEIPALATALAARLGVGGGAQAAAASHPLVDTMVRDLQQAGSRGVVIAGDTQPAEIHALCAAINAALGSTIVRYLDTGEAPIVPQHQALQGLVRDMQAGNVDVLLMLDVNPVYSLPPEYGFADALARVENSIHVGLHIDETAQVSRWHLPLAHYLEAWGDGRSYDGTLSVIQPLIAPLYADAKSEVEVVNTLATGLDQPGYELVREQWAGLVGGEQGWRRVLHDGFLPNTAYPVVTAGAAASLPAVQTPDPEAIEVVFRLDPKLLDGRFANNVWMLELPHHTTKIVWDNVALMSRATAERLGLEVEYDAGKFYTDRIELSAAGRTVGPLPVWIQPGLPDNTIHVQLGWGRSLRTERELPRKKFFDTDTYSGVYTRGPVANGVGVNVAPLRSAQFESVVVGAQVRKVDGGYMLASTQEHGTMEGRPIVRMASLEKFRQNPTFALDEVPPLAGREPWSEYPALWEERHPTGEPGFQDSLYYKNQWGMVIDLNKCTGCNACVIACNSENNIHMVGKQEVSRGREMHWMRIDRYFVSEAEEMDEPRMVMQPMLCQHCENAPCEPVCPVAATSHSADGINEMTYNRCIGTRYCSNNCPYKVRRYNFFNWAKTAPETVELWHNPNVTVRFRGVMEKCTYCVQRVREVQRQADIEKRTIRDREVLTACQQVCPAEAIVFGDLNDPNSQVQQQKRNPRRYEVLGELNTQPRTSYLSQVWNPHPSLAGDVSVVPDEPAHH